MRSLAARDGLSTGRGLLLWLEYSLAALEAAADMPVVVVDYPGLLADWRSVVAKLAGLPGLAGQVPGDAAAAQIEAFLDPGRQHHANAGSGAMPAAIERAWEAMRVMAPGDAQTAPSACRPFSAAGHCCNAAKYGARSPERGQG